MVTPVHPTMTVLFLGLAGLGCLTAAVIHSVLGERLFIRPIQPQMTWPGGRNAADLSRQIVRLAWHVTSLMWAGFGALFIAPLLGFRGVTAVYAIAAAIFGVAFVMTGPMTAWRHRGWPVFALITASLAAALMTST